MLEIGFAPCLRPFSMATVEGCVFWLPGNLYQKTIFLLQILLSKITLKSPYTVCLCTSANGQLKYLYSLPQEGDRWGVSQAGHQGPVTSTGSSLIHFPLWAIEISSFLLWAKVYRIEKALSKDSRWRKCKRLTWMHLNSVFSWFPRVKIGKSIYPGYCYEN